MTRKHFLALLVFFIFIGGIGFFWSRRTDLMGRFSVPSLNSQVQCQSGTYPSPVYDVFVDFDTQNAQTPYHDINTVASTVASGAKVAVCPGTYPVGFNLEGKTLYFFGVGSVPADTIFSPDPNRVQMPNVDNGLINLFPDSNQKKSSLGLGNLTLSGDPDTASILAVGGSKVYLSRFVGTSAKFALFLVKGAEAEIQDSTFLDNSLIFALGSNSNLTIDHSTFNGGVQLGHYTYSRFFQHFSARLSTSAGIQNFPYNGGLKVKVANSRFENTEGTSFSFDLGDIAVKDSIFTGNESKNPLSSLFYAGHSDVYFENVEFRNNYGASGVLFFSESDFKMRNSTFSENIAGLASEVFLLLGSGRGEIFDSSFSENSIANPQPRQGWGLAATPAAVLMIDPAWRLKIKDSDFLLNTPQTCSGNLPVDLGGNTADDASCGF